MEDKPDPLQAFKEGIIHRDTLSNLMAIVLGSNFDEKEEKDVFDSMKPDANGMISVDGFIEAFSENQWPPETLAMVADFLENSPDLVKRPGDWKTILANFGLDISEENVGQLICHGRKGVADLFKLQLNKQRQLDKSEVRVWMNEFVSSIEGKLQELEIGSGVTLSQKSCEEESASGSRD